MKFIIIKAVDKPKSDDPDDFIKWFCKVFGLESEFDDKENIEEILLKEFIKAAYYGKGLSSGEISLSNVPRTTIIYHLNRLIDTGMIVKKGRRYYLRASEFSDVIDEIEYDVNREIMKIKDIADEFERITRQLQAYDEDNDEGDFKLKSIKGRSKKYNVKIKK